jgi:DNA recombination protein RmuC
MQLKRVGEMAGMLDHCDFLKQESVATDDGRLRPDLIVRRLGDKSVVVDAKAPVDAYLAGIESQDDATRKNKFAGHTRQIRNHVIALSRKSYGDQFEATPEFVVLFLPGEN